MPGDVHRCARQRQPDRRPLKVHRGPPFRQQPSHSRGVMLRLPLRPCRPQDLALNQTIAVPACHIGAVDMQRSWFASHHPLRKLLQNGRCCSLSSKLSNLRGKVEGWFVASVDDGNRQSVLLTPRSTRPNLVDGRHRFRRDGPSRLEGCERDGRRTARSAQFPLRRRNRKSFSRGRRSFRLRTVRCDAVGVKHVNC